MNNDGPTLTRLRVIEITTEAWTRFIFLKHSVSTELKSGKSSGPDVMHKSEEIRKNLFGDPVV